MASAQADQGLDAKVSFQNFKCARKFEPPGDSLDVYVAASNVGGVPHLLTATGDDDPLLWNFREKSLVKRLPGVAYKSFIQCDPVFAIDYGAGGGDGGDGKPRLYALAAYGRSHSKPGGLRAWNVDSEGRGHHIEETGSKAQKLVKVLAFERKGKHGMRTYVLTANNQGVIHLWKLHGDRIVHKDEVSARFSRIQDIAVFTHSENWFCASIAVDKSDVEVRALFEDIDTIKFKAEAQYRSPMLVRALSVDGARHIIVGQTNGGLAMFNVFDGPGKEVWKVDLGGEDISAMVVHKDSLIVGTDEGGIYVLDCKDGGSIASLKQGEEVSSLVIIQDRESIVLVSADEDGYVRLWSENATKSSDGFDRFYVDSDSESKSDSDSE